MNSPLISVIMPVYNGEKYLKEAIDSILNQTFTDFEFIILNDGSTDKTEDIVLGYDTPRIRYVKNEINLKISKTLNKGIALAKGKYIARMDADDISLPERFEKQVKFMDDNLDIGVSGTWLQTFGDSCSIWSPPESHEEIIIDMLFRSPLMHPTVFIRKKILLSMNKIYNESFNGVEDYELWTRLSKITKLANIPEVLLNYRINDFSKNRKHYKNKQLLLANLVRNKYLANNIIECSKCELELHNKLACKEYLPTDAFLIDSRKWLLNIIESNSFSRYHCKNILIVEYYNVCNVLVRETHVFLYFLRFLKDLKSMNYNMIFIMLLKSIYHNIKYKFFKPSA